MGGHHGGGLGSSLGVPSVSSSPTLRPLRLRSVTHSELRHGNPACVLPAGDEGRGSSGAYTLGTQVGDSDIPGR